jgi:hypothetical protein
LGVTVNENDPIGMTGICVCQHCGHNFSFTDHVESAWSLGVHTIDDLKWIFTGDKYFLTVVTEKQRQLLCPDCGTKSLFPRFCYVGNNYAYAEGD